MTDAVGSGLLVDLRSGTYVGFWRPAGVRTATVRVLHEHQGRRKVVSHFNKATRAASSGRSSRPAPTRDPARLADALRDLGWSVELDGDRLDVVVSEL